MQFQPKFIYLLLGWLIFATACKTTKPVRPMEKYDDINLEILRSTIKIPIRIDKNELQKSLNEQLGEVLYEDTDMSDDDMMIRAKKSEDIQLEIENDTLRYRVPLDLWIKRDVFIGSVEAEGRLALDFKTSYKIERDWTLVTFTEVAGSNWLEKPKLKLGIVDLPIEFIANKVLNRTRSLIASSIDEEVKKNLDLKTQINSAWTELHQPILLSEEYKTWLLFRPKNIGMSPLKVDKDTIESTILLESEPQISLGMKPLLPIINPLPDFEFKEEKGDDFSLFLGTEVPFEEIQRISKENLIGESYSYGSKTVKIEDIELYGQGKRLVINTLLSGWYNGNVYLLGIPKYNSRTNKIELDDLKFESSSKKFIMKTLSWLFRSRFKNEVQESVNYYLAENLAEVKKMIQNELNDYKIANGITLKGNLEELNISQVKIGKEVFKIEVALKGKLAVDIKGIGN